MDGYNEYDIDEDEQESEILNGPARALLELENAPVPDKVKGIRACMRCGLLKTYEQFMEGCDNCPFLQMEANPESVNVCTTAFFEGRVGVMSPRESWVAKWLRIDNYLPGVYAISVTGEFPKEIEDRLESAGRRWRCKPAT